MPPTGVFQSSYSWLTHRYRGIGIYITTATSIPLAVAVAVAVAVVFDLAFDLDLRRPVNHAGRTQA